MNKVNVFWLEKRQGVGMSRQFGPSDKAHIVLFSMMPHTLPSSPSCSELIRVPSPAQIIPLFLQHNFYH